MNDLKVSRFTLSEPLPGQTVGLFNTLTRALGAIPAEVWDQAAAGRLDGDEIVNELAAQGFLIDSGLDEDLILAHWRASQAYDLTHLKYLVSPTHACNMACSYCVHGRKKRAEHMSPDTARSVLEFILTDLEVKQPQTARLDFCGAEALLNPRVMVYLAEGLSRFCRGRGIDFKISLITNGLGLKPDLIQTLNPLGLERVRVTISGPAEIHNKYRPAKDNRPTYDRIMNNLAEVAGLTEISIQGQYNPANGEHLRFPELLDDLAARGLKDHVADVFFGPFVPFESTGDKGAALAAVPIGCLVDEDPGRCLWLQDQIADRGFTHSQGPPSNNCLACYRNSMVIDVEGQITVCPSMMDYPELEYGHVTRGVDFYREAALLARDLPEECRQECALAPLCDGGCRHQALTRSGDFNGVNCLGRAYEHLTRAYIRQAVRV